MRLVTLGLGASLGTSVVASSTRAGADVGMIDYVVRAGDDCEVVTRRFYGDPKSIDAFHAANPQLGPVPHHLRPGMVLQVPADAKLSFVRNHVDAFTPAQHPGHAEEPLMRGHRVSTYDASGAQVAFANQAILQLGEDTLVVILGGSRGAVSKTAAAGDTTLVNGSLRAHLAALAGAPDSAVVTTPSGHRIEVHPGDAQVTVDRSQATRLAVYKGRGALTAKNATVAVPEGFGSKAEKDAPPTPPRPLPPAPRWVTSLPAITFASAPVDVDGWFAPSLTPGPAATSWHVQLSKDEAFNDLLVDARVGLDVKHVDARGLTAGTYYARVSAIGDDQFEGPPSVTDVVIVAPLLVHVAPRGGQAATLDVPAGLYCGLDGAPLALTAGPLAFQAGPEHHLRCADTADGDGATDTLVPARGIGPLALDAELPRAVPGDGAVTLRLRDAAGAPVLSPKVQVVGLDGAAIASLQPGPEPGTFVAHATWPAAGPTLRLRVLVDGIDTIDTPPLAVPLAPAPPEPERRTLLSVLGGATVPAQSTTVGGSVGAEALRRWSPGAYTLSTGVRGAWELHGLGSSDQPADNLVGISAPLVLGLGGASARWQPFVALAPEVLLDSVGPSETKAVPAAEGRVGVLLRASVMHAVFAELGFRVTPQYEAGATRVERDAFFVDLGYRLGL